MIKKLKNAIGAAVGRSEYAPEPSVVGEVEQSGAGNSVLRVGKLARGGTWTQTEHVVLTPDEREELIAVLESQREYRVIEIGDTVGVGLTVLAVQYLNATADDGRLRGTVLAYCDRKREYAVLTADPHGDVHYGTYTTDLQKALNAYATRIVEHLYPHFNASPPTLTFGRVADRDKLKPGEVA